LGLEKLSFRFGSDSFEASKSGVLTAEQEAMHEGAAESAVRVEVVNLILSEKEAGCLISESDGQWFVHFRQRKLCARQQCHCVPNQVFSFRFVACHVDEIPDGERIFDRLAGF
jgi:hypothetical protein